MTDAQPVSHEQPGLFVSADREQPFETHASQSASPSSLGAGNSDSSERTARTRRSMLWAAYGDALGFISELVDRRGLERRTQGAHLDHLMDWERRVGGRFGVDTVLPAGCWSDDTQLRMAVSRSIDGRRFDVETFARVELPVWLSYALGGGRASKAAAKNLAKPRTLWYANTYSGWADAGGNGAAMRIHPHVWASSDLDSDYLLDVIVNSVCTHGHPRALVGACFHAATLAHCLSTGVAPDSDTCVNIAGRVGINALRLIEEHSILGSTWTGLWAQETGEQFGDRWRQTVDELLAAIGTADECTQAADSLEAVYARVVDGLGLRIKKQQGSGILTTVAATAVAATAPKTHEGVVVAANAIGTDTDTIGTMAGALLGACDGAADPPEEPLDGEYLRSEAERLTAVSRGLRTDTHRYPDILTWTAPETQSDALVSDAGSLAVEGLGRAIQIGVGPIYAARRNFAWEWVRTSFGQTLLIKRRPEIRVLAAENSLSPPPAPQERPSRGTAEAGRRVDDIAPPRPLDRGVKVDDAIEYARRRIADDEALGYTVRRVARDGTFADLAALVTAIREDLRR